MESIAQLKWQCRRGTKELDYLLENYLDEQYNQTNDKERRLFITLLKLPDCQLILFLLGNQLPKSKELASLVKKIRTQSNIYH